MKKMNKVDRAIQSLRQAILETENHRLRDYIEHLDYNLTLLFIRIIDETPFFGEYSQLSAISDSELNRIDELVAEIVLKHTHPGNDKEEVNGKDII